MPPEGPARGTGSLEGLASVVEAMLSLRPNQGKSGLD